MKALRISSSRNEYEPVDLTQTQRLLVSGYPKRPVSVYALLRIHDSAAARAFLLSNLARVDSADGGREDDGSGYKVAIAFTFAGLRMLGLKDPEALETFIPEFRQGMTGAHRARVIGDVGDNASTNWLWGVGEREPHVLYAVLASDEAGLDWPGTEKQLRAEAPGLELIDAIRCNASDTEPFGFKDNISQPFVEDFQPTGKAAREHEPRVAAGEFVLGYKNEFGQLPASPWVREKRAGNLPKVSPARDERWDLGKNGSFLVVRELHQNVAAFQALRKDVQENMIGRRTTGESLAVGAWHSPKDQNDFNYYAEDRHGLRCPMGSHARRSNPRDALANEELGVTPADALALANQHRILRRSRVLGPERAQGILFMCFNTNIDRQFEFVQQTWLDNPKFARSDERDAIVSNHRGDNTFTYGEGPRRSTVGPLANYVSVRGGAYFFMPSLNALAYLARLA